PPEAGVRRGLLHYHFGTKRDLFLEVVRSLTVPSPDLAVPPPGDLGLPETIDLCVERFLDAAEANADTWFAALDAEGFGQDPELMRIVNRARDLTVEHLLRVLGLADPTDTLRVILRTYSGLADVATREWLQQKTIDRARAHTLLSRSLLALITDVAPAVERG
ncbi:MAG TPA: TetR/AcrR family transcriptional regulator, partial [Thermomonospora sp.]|nr:TetR/AcrR family transcriptional regulator [Thermomonospora sp.]